MQPSIPAQIEAWNVSNVRDMTRMFARNAGFNQPLNGWTTTSLESTRSMFDYAEAFNQPLDRWDTSSLTSIDNMFECVHGFDQDLGWVLGEDCSGSVRGGTWAFHNTRCESWDCGLNGATPPPTAKPTFPEATGAAAATPLLLPLLLLLLGVAALA